MRRLGENISAWEIETVLNAHPAVLDSAAHAVASVLSEDEVKVCIVPRTPTVDPAEILQYCEGRIARHAVPRYIELVEGLPKTATERNQYEALRRRGLTLRTCDRVEQRYCPAAVTPIGEGVHA